MIGVELIEELVTIGLWTSYLDDEHPQSLLILSEVEGGKSAIAEEFESNNGIAFPHDATAYGIIKAYGKKFEQGTLKHLIFPEMIFPLSRTYETVNVFLALLNGLMGEGIREIQTFATSITFTHLVYCGVIGCLARQEFENRKSHWQDNGFLSRFLPISYSHSSKLQDLIFASIDVQQKDVVVQQLKFKPGHVKLDHKLASKLSARARKIAVCCSKQGTRQLAGYRAKKSLQRMAKALALSKGLSEVTQVEIDRILELSKYINLDFEEI
jgi:hypothetical protein